jgi:hypothetical protein
MAKRVDWLDFAHLLDKERVAIEDGLPKGMTVHLSLSAYGYSAAEFSVHLSHRETGVSGYGGGRTPAKALEAAKAELQKKVEEQQRRPRLVEAKPKALEG